MVKISRNRMVLSRISKLRRAVKIDTQKLRGKALKSLEELFRLAKRLAKNKELDLNTRRKWVQVTGYICQVINSICKGFDERQIDVQLDELERLVIEAKSKTKNERTKEGVNGSKKAEAAKGSS